MRTTPLKHQQECFDISKDREYFALFLEQGLGKTKIIIDNAFYLFNEGKIDRVIVIAPSGVHRNWAESELPKHAWEPYDIVVWKPGNLPRTCKSIETLAGSVKLKWLCVNIEAIRKLPATLVKFITKTSMVVVDESTIIKNHHAIQTKAAISLGRKANYRRILNGTPVTQGPMDLWGQCLFLYHNVFDQHSFISFRGMYAETMMQVMGTKYFTKIIGYKNLHVLTESLKRFSIRLEKSECLDLPEKIYARHPVELTVEQKKMYKEMKELRVAELKKEERENGVVSAPSVLSALIKLQQIANGFIIDEDKVPHPISNNRIEALKVLLGTAPKKTVIWSLFRAPIPQIVAMLKLHHGANCVVEYHGGISQDNRAVAVREFQENPKTLFFVASYAAKKGLNLYAASNMIYYSNSYSLDTRLQSEDRIHRIGQDRGCLYTDLYSPDTVDEKIHMALMGKRDIADQILKVNWKQILGV